MGRDQQLRVECDVQFNIFHTVLSNIMHSISIWGPSLPSFLFLGKIAENTEYNKVRQRFIAGSILDMTLSDADTAP